MNNTITQPDEESKKLTESVSREITETTLDLSIDYAELNLDSIFGDEIIKEIPIVKTLYAIGKIGISITERFFIKKLLTFLKQLHSNSLSEADRKKFNHEFDTDHKYREKVTEHIIVYVNSFLDVEKAKILARLFRAHITGDFDWQHFVHLSSCLNSLNLSSIQLLKKLSEKDFQTDPKDKNRDFNSEALLSAGGIGFSASPWSSNYYISDAGKDLYNFGVKDN